MSSLPRNGDVAEQFELLADLLELEGAQSFRVLAYRRAAQRMRNERITAHLSFTAGPTT